MKFHRPLKSSFGMNRDCYKRYLDDIIRILRCS